MSGVLLEIKQLTVRFAPKANLLSRNKGSEIVAANNINLTIHENEIHGLVGESGSGKSTIGRSIMGLNKVAGGDILFNGKSLVTQRGREDVANIQMVFQDPHNSLPPNMRIGQILLEPLMINHALPKDMHADKVCELLEMVDLPADYARKYPHQLSGGQKQRIAVARAMALHPKLIVADEPTSALDVSVQAQILNLLMDLKEKHGISILFISHNLSVVRHISDRISVMQHGKIVESGSREDIFENAKDAYTKTLLAAIPRMRLTEDAYKEPKEHAHIQLQS